MAPPLDETPVAKLSVTLQRRRLSRAVGPEKKMAPPLPGAWLAVMTQSVKFNTCPNARTAPPPAVDLPPVKVTPVTVMVVPLGAVEVLKMRDVPLPLTVAASAPGPVI